jgi:hypothetical protein
VRSGKRKGKPQRGGPNIAQGVALGFRATTKTKPQRGGPIPSQGNALGYRQNAPLVRVNWGNTIAFASSFPQGAALRNAWGRPFGAFSFWVPNTQGVALGYIRVAPLGLVGNRSRKCPLRPKSRGHFRGRLRHFRERLRVVGRTPIGNRLPARIYFFQART